MFTSTRSSKLKHYSDKTCETVMFEKKKSMRLNSGLDSNAKKNIFDTKETKLDLRKLRYDVIKLGTSGFAGTKREESDVVLAVSLGAKPPKNKFRNYKEILLEKKTAKQQYEYVGKAKVSNNFLKKSKLIKKKG